MTTRDLFHEFLRLLARYSPILGYSEQDWEHARENWRRAHKQLESDPRRLAGNGDPELQDEFEWLSKVLSTWDYIDFLNKYLYSDLEFLEGIFLADWEHGIPPQPEELKDVMKDSLTERWSPYSAEKHAGLLEAWPKAMQHLQKLHRREIPPSHPKFGLAGVAKPAAKPDDLERRSGRRERPTEYRKKIVRKFMKSPRDFNNQKKLNRLLRGLDDEGIELPRRKGGPSPNTHLSYSDLRPGSKSYGLVIQVLKRDLYDRGTRGKKGQS